MDTGMTFPWSERFQPEWIIGKRFRQTQDLRDLPLSKVIWNLKPERTVGREINHPESR